MAVVISSVLTRSTEAASSAVSTCSPRVTAISAVPSGSVESAVPGAGRSGTDLGALPLGAFSVAELSPGRESGARDPDVTAFSAALAGWGPSLPAPCRGAALPAVSGGWRDDTLRRSCPRSPVSMITTITRMIVAPHAMSMAGDVMYERRQYREPTKGQARREPGGHAKPWVHPIALPVGHDSILPQVRHEEGQTGRRVIARC